MDTQIEIVKAFCKLNSFKTDSQIVKQMAERLKQCFEIQEKTGQLRYISCHFYLYSDKKKTILLDNSANGKNFELKIHETKEDITALFSIGNVYFHYLPDKEEWKNIRFLLKTPEKKDIKSSEELNQAILSSIQSSTGEWNKAVYNQLQAFFKIKAEPFKSVELDYGIKRICRVIEHGNKRYYFYQQQSYYANKKPKFGLTTPDKPEYNYIDEGRYFYNKVYFELDIDPEEIRYDIAREIENSTANEIYLVTKDIFERFKGKAKAKTNDKNNHEKFKKKFLRKVLNGFEYNGIRISRKEISFKRKKIKIFNSNLANFIKTRLEFENRPSFNDIVSEFVSYIEYNFNNNKAKIQLGIHIFEAELKNTHKNYETKINGKAIRNIETGKILALLYTAKTKREFNRTAEACSKYGYNITKELNKEIYLKVCRENKAEYLNFKIELIKNRLTIKAENRKVYLKNPEKLNLMLKEDSYHPINIFEFIKYLIKDECLQSNTVFAFLNSARKKYKTAEKKSRAYLNEAVLETCSKRRTIEIDSKKTNGYVVKGELSEYFVTADAKVYRLPSKKYVCIYDPDKNFFVNDTIGNRLFALKDDISFKETIHTIQDKTATV